MGKGTFYRVFPARHVGQYFPPDLPSIRHLVINSLAQQALLEKKHLSAWLLPNVLDFEKPPPAPNSYVADLRQTLGLGPYDYLMLQPTRVVPRKGIVHAVELLQRLDDPRCKSLLLTHPAGDEGVAYLHDLQSQADKSGVTLLYVAQHFAPTRRTTPKGQKIYSLWDAYKVADFVTYPSLIEGFGNALLEAVYFRVPALVNRYPVYKADIASRGFDFVEIDGVVSIEAVERVARILHGTGDRQRMVEHNFTLGREHYSYRVAQATLVEVLNSFDWEKRLN